MKKKVTFVPLLAFLSLVLTIGLIAAIPTFALDDNAVTPASNGSTEFRFDVDDTDVLYGDEFVFVRVSMTDFIDPGFRRLRFTLQYDSTFLTLMNPGPPRKVYFQYLQGYPHPFYWPDITYEPAFISLNTGYLMVPFFTSALWEFRPQTGRYFPTFGDPNSVPWMPSELITLGGPLVQVPMDRAMPPIRGPHHSNGLNGEAGLSHVRIAIYPTLAAEAAQFHKDEFFAEFSFRISPNAQIGDYAKVTLIPEQVTSGVPLRDRPVVGGSGYVRIVDAPPPPPPQIAFHLYTPHATIVDRFGDHATSNADGIHVIHVPVIPGKPYYEWPDQALLQSVLEIGHIFSVDGIPGHSFWGWFTDETLDAANRPLRNGLRRPWQGDICDWEYGTTRILPGIFDILQNEYITDLQMYELFGADRTLNLYGVWARWGDLNDDDRVCDLDSILMIDYLLNRITSYQINYRAANVVFDDVVCEHDFILLQRFLTNQIPIHHLGRPSQIEDAPGFIPGEFRFNIDNVTASQGDEYVYVRINMTEFCGDGFSSLRFGVLYDSSLLTLDMSPRIMRYQRFHGYPNPMYIPGMTDEPAFMGIITNYVQVPLSTYMRGDIIQTGRYFPTWGDPTQLPWIPSEEITLRSFSQGQISSRLPGTWGEIHPTGARMLEFRRLATAEGFINFNDLYIVLSFRIAANAQVGDYAQISIVPIQVLSNGRIRAFPEQSYEEMGSVTIVN